MRSDYRLLITGYLSPPHPPAPSPPWRGAARRAGVRTGKLPFAFIKLNSIY